MTWPTEQAREAVAQVRELKFGLAFGLPDDVSSEVVHDAILAALAPHVAALVRAERAAALREAAEAIDLEMAYDMPGDVTDLRNAEGAAEAWLRLRAEAEEAGR